VTCECGIGGVRKGLEGCIEVSSNELLMVLGRKVFVGIVLRAFIGTMSSWWGEK
jgi:hypothetical protein